MADWQTVTLIDSKMIAEGVKSLIFGVPDWRKHKAGQYYDVRLTSANGYQAVRKYSVASVPEEEGIIEFGIQYLENGEVSPYLFELKQGQQIELRGPLGGHFVWSSNMPGPLVLIGGGSGMVPLISMLRHYVRHPKFNDDRQAVVFTSAKTLGQILYKDEIDGYSNRNPKIKFAITLTGQPPSGWTGYNRRIDAEMLKREIGDLKSEMPMIYVCGPTPFVENAAGALLDLGFDPHFIKTERFGG